MLKLSIITTSLNRVTLLQKTLDSVLAQNYPDIEQLVFDAASQDGTVEMLKNYEKKFEKKNYAFRWISEKDSGQGEAMNKGLKMVTGDCIMILNSDDFLCEKNLSLFIERLNSSPTIDLIYGNHDNLYEDGRRQTIFHHLYSWQDLIYKAYQIPQSAAIFRKNLIDQVGGFNESLHHVAEHELFLRMVKAGANVFYLPVILQVTLEHVGRKTTANAKRAAQETKMVNFRYGGSYFSRFYLLHLKYIYFDWFFNFLQNKLPKAYNMLKYIFNKFTS